MIREIREKIIMEGLGIDLKFLLAQLVNFVILFVILTKLLYGPIRRVIEKRSKEIEESVKNAEKIKEELASVEKTKALEIEKAKKEAETVISETKESAKELSAKINREAEEKAEQIISKAKNEIEAEKEKSVKSMKDEIAAIVEESVEKILAGKISDKEQKELVEESIKEIEL